VGYSFDKAIDVKGIIFLFCDTMKARMFDVLFDRENGTIQKLNFFNTKHLRSQ